MKNNDIVLAVFLFTFLAVLYFMCLKQKKTNLKTFKAHDSTVYDFPDEESPIDKVLKPESEKQDNFMKFLNKFMDSKKLTAEDLRKKRENEYIDSLPEDSGCSDKFSSCKDWAAAGECSVNPEFMLYNCANSCQACKLSPTQKYNLVKIFNSRDPVTCVYHGEPYPDSNNYLINNFLTTKL